MYLTDKIGVLDKLRAVVTYTAVGPESNANE